MQNNHIKLKPSKQFTRFFLSLLGATLLLIGFLPCSCMVKIILIIITIGYGSMIGRQPWQGLLQQEDRWELHYPNKIIQAQLCGSSTVTRYVCILRFRLPNQWVSYACVLFPDSFDSPEDFRRFRVQLKTSQSQLI
jgi:hypothetical protein